MIHNFPACFLFLPDFHDSGACLYEVRPTYFVGEFLSWFKGQIGGGNRLYLFLAGITKCRMGKQQSQYYPNSR